MTIYIPPATNSSGLNQQQVQEIVNSAVAGYLPITGGSVSGPFQLGDTVVFNNSTSQTSWKADGTNTYSMPAITRYYYQYTESAPPASTQVFSGTLPGSYTGADVVNMFCIMQGSDGSTVLPNNTIATSEYFEIYCYSNQVNIGTGPSFSQSGACTWYLWLDILT